MLTQHQWYVVNPDSGPFPTSRYSLCFVTLPHPLELVDSSSLPQGVIYTYKIGKQKGIPRMMSYLEEIEKRNVFHNGPIQALVMLKEEEIGESSVDELWVFPAEFDQLQSLFAAVTAPPDSCGVLPFPGRPRVSLHRHHVQTDSKRQEAEHVFLPNCQFTRSDRKGLPKASKPRPGVHPDHVSPAHGFEDRVSQVVGRHHDIPGVCGATPRKDGLDVRI